MADEATSRRTLLAGTLAGSAFGGLLLATDDAEAAVVIPTDPSVQFFVDVDGIPGDSLDLQFPNTFEALDWSYGAITSVGPTHTSGARSKVKPQPFTFVIRTTKSSPKLFLACCTGKHIKKASIVARKQSDKQQYLKVTLTDVYVSSYRSAPGAADAVPLDVVGLDYRAIEIVYTAQNPAGGPGTRVRAGFDFVKNRVL